MTNSERADYADHAAYAFERIGGGSRDDPRTLVSDLICDLGHWLKVMDADLTRYDVIRAMAHGIGMYNAEARAETFDPYANDKVSLEIQQHDSDTGKPLGSLTLDWEPLI